MYFTFQIGFSKVDVGEIFLLGSKADKAFFAGLKKKKRERFGCHSGQTNL